MANQPTSKKKSRQARRLRQMTHTERSLNRSPWLARATQIALLLLLFFYWLAARAVQGVDYTLVQPESLVRLQSDFPLLEPILPVLRFILELFSPNTLIHFLPIALGVMAARALTIEVMQLLYDMPSYGDTASFLRRLRGAYFMRPLPINRLHFHEQMRENEILRLGGPGYIIIAESDAAVTEINGRFERVIGKGRYQLHRFERIVTVLDLREQERSDNGVEVMTREGIIVHIELFVNFQIKRRTGARSEYAFDPEAARKAAYTSTVFEFGPSSWISAPLPIASILLKNIVSGKRLDELVDPKKVYEARPNPEIQGQIEGILRNILRGMGIDLLSVRVGALRVSDEIRETLVKYWATWGEKPKPLAESNIGFTFGEFLEKSARESMIKNLSSGLQSIREDKVTDPRRARVPLGIQQMQASQRPQLESGAPSSPSDTNQLIMLRMLNLLEQVVAQPQLSDPTGQTVDPELRDKRDELAARLRNMRSTLGGNDSAPIQGDYDVEAPIRPQLPDGHVSAPPPRRSAGRLVEKPRPSDSDNLSAD